MVIIPWDKIPFVIGQNPPGLCLNVSYDLRALRNICKRTHQYNLNAVLCIRTSAVCIKILNCPFVISTHHTLPWFPITFDGKHR